MEEEKVKKMIVVNLCNEPATKWVKDEFGNFLIRKGSVVFALFKSVNVMLSFERIIIDSKEFPALKDLYRDLQEYYPTNKPNLEEIYKKAFNKP